MKIKESNHGISIHDLPLGLSGVYTTDVVFPNGQYAALQGASPEAHLYLQDEIGVITDAVSMSPKQIICSVIDQYNSMLREAAENAA